MMTMSTRRDAGGVPIYSIRFADASQKWGIALASGVAQSITIPSTAQKWNITFSYEPGAEVWVARNTTAAVPSGGTPTHTESELLPIIREVDAGDTISFISPAACNVGVIILPA